MIQGGKASHFLIITEALCCSDVFTHYGSHFLFVRHGHRFFEQHLYEIGASRLGAFFVIQVLLEYFIAHLVSTS